MSLFDNIKKDLEKGASFSQIDPQTLVDCAEEVGQGLSVEGLKNHQLRRFYDTVKQIERKTWTQKEEDQLKDALVAQLLFLRPHLANTESRAKREDKPAIKRLRTVLDPCLNSKVIKNKADLTRFVKFFEAIVAYAQ